MPNLDNEDTVTKFQKNVDEICVKLIPTFGLMYEQSANRNLHEVLLRWLDFRLRYIEPQPRKIVTSSKFPLTLPNDISSALSSFERAIMLGSNVNAYQSTSLTCFNDTSGEKRQKRTDGLWADWGIHHIHLTNESVPEGKTYSKRSNWLLFFAVFEDVVAFIDVRKHDEQNIFQLHELVETFLLSWPDHAERYRLKGALGLANSATRTSTGTAMLRKSGVTQLIELNGAVYAPPGMGLTTAATATRVSLARNNIRRWTREIANLVDSPDSVFRKEAQGRRIESPQFEISLIPPGDLAVVETISMHAWLLPRTNPQKDNNLFCAWHNLLLPPWAGKALHSYWTAHP